MREIKTYSDIDLNANMPKSQHENIIIGTGGINLTISTIIDVVNSNIDPLIDFANKIKGDSLEKTLYNIWYYIKSNIKYTKDKEGIEEIRTPQRTLNDRIGDCDDYSILVATILKSLGYEPFFYVVAFKNSKNYGHIYVGLNDYVIDGVMNVFNKHPESITKTMIVNLKNEKKVINRGPYKLNLANMIVQKLEGLSTDGDGKDELLNDLIDSEYNRLSGIGEITEDENDNFNIIKTLKVLKGTPERDYLMTILPAVAGIDDDMNVHFHEDKDVADAEKFLKEFQNLQGLGDVSGLDGWFSKVKKWAKKTKNKIKKKIKKDWKKFKKVAKKVTHIIKKVGLAPARGAILLLLKLNLFKWGSRLWLSYLPISKVKSLGMNVASFKKLVNFREKFERFFEKAGGNKKYIFKAVSGRGARKAKKKYGISGTDNIGFVATAGTAGAVASASPFLAFLGAAWGAVKYIFKNLFKKGGLKKGGKMFIAAVKKYREGRDEREAPKESSENYPDEKSLTEKVNEEDKGVNAKKSNLPLYLAIGGGILMLMKFL